METLNDSITRVEIAIPLNNNTSDILEDLVDFITKTFGGLTQTKIVYPSAYTGIWISPEDTVYIEEIAIFIVYFKFEEIPNALEELEFIAKILLSSGEEESWVIYQSASRIKCSAI